jgi:hypothetical protein
MSFNKLNAFTKKVADAADQLTGNPAEAKALFDAAPEELRTYFNNLVDALKSSASGDSGAKNLGASGISGLTGNDVQTLLQNLKTIVDGKVDAGTNTRMEICSASFFTNGGSNTATATVTFGKAFTSPPTATFGNITAGTNIPYSNALLTPVITTTTSGMTVTITAQGGNLGTIGSPANLVVNFLVFGN